MEEPFISERREAAPLAKQSPEEGQSRFSLHNEPNVF